MKFHEINHRRFETFLWLLAPLVAASLALGAAETKSRAKKSARAAPTQEDCAAYFSSPKEDTTEEKLRMADELRVTTISSIQNLLKTTARKTNEFELYLRMGEIYLERHDYIRGLEVADFEKKHDAWSKTQKGTEPKIDHSKSHAQLLDGANAFRRLVTKFPHHERTDAALFELGKTLGRLDNDNAELYFKQLISQYPRSSLVAPTYLALGEFYFDRHRIPQAVDAYKAAMKYKDNEIYPYAVYKLGWAFYNADAKNDKKVLENNQHALASFKLVVALASKSDATKRSIDLRKESLNDLVMVWADIEGVDDAWTYFSKLGEKNSFYDLLERLGGIYVEQGQNEKAILTYTRLLAEAAQRPNNPEIYSKLADLRYRTNQHAALVNDLSSMGTLYVATSTWTEANKKSPTALAEAVDRTERNMHRYATLYHQRGQKLHSDELLHTATQLYHVYLNNFAKSEAAYEMRYYLADILFYFKQYESAADEYMTVANQSPKNGKYLKESAYNAVLAITKLDETEKNEKLPPPGQVPSPLEIPRVKQKLITAIDRYLKLLPTEPEGNAMRYTVAQIYFDYGHYQIALGKFNQIALAIPESKQGKASLKVILAYYGQRKDWDQLIANARQFLDTKKFTDKELNTALVDSLKMAVYQKALALQDEKKYQASAEMFLSFQKDFPGDKNADRALYNAGLNYYKIGEVEKALAVSKAILDKYPASSLADDVTIDIAGAYEGLANFDQAAEFYERFYHKYRLDKRASMALYNAAILNQGLKKTGKAIELFDAFIKNFPRNNLITSAHYDLAKLYDKDKKYKNEIEVLASYQSRLADKKSDDFLEAQARIAQINYRYVNNGKGQHMLRELTKDLTKNNKQPAFEARRIIAETLFADLEPEVNAFRAMSLRDSKKLEREVKKKQEKLVALASRFEGIIDVGSGEYTVASLYRIGEMHEKFAADLFNVPPPAGSTQIQIDAFRTSLEKVAFPLREEAQKFYEGAYKNAQEIQTFSEWTRLAYKKMTDLDPDKYSKIAEKGTAPVYLEHAMRWDNALSSITGE